MSQESLAQFRNIRSRGRVDCTDIGDIFDVSPGVSLLVVEAAVINVLTYQFYGCLVAPFVNLKMYVYIFKCVSVSFVRINRQTRRLSRENSTSPHDLDLWPTQMKPSNGTSNHYGEQLYWNSSKIAGDMVQTKNLPSSVTLTLGLPEQMFKMAHLHMMDNNCVKSFWNPSTIVEVIVRTNLDAHTHWRQLNTFDDFLQMF